MSERWFLAIWLDEAARQALLHQLSSLGRLPGRPTHPLDWHLTLVFIGELSAAGLTCVESATARIQAAPFMMTLDRLGHFARSQVLWCGPGQTPAPLTQLVLDLQLHLGACDVKPDPRPYCPHLTLARGVRAALPLQIEPTIGWTVSELVLAYGVSKAVPRYRIHRRYPFRQDVS